MGRPRKYPVVIPEGQGPINVLEHAAQEAVKEVIKAENKALKKLPGIFEVRRIGTHGFVFASFGSGIQFWVQFSKTTERREIIDLFDAHIEQYAWKLGHEVKIPGEDPIWKYETVEGLQYLHHPTGKIHNIKGVERIKDVAKTKDTGRPFYEFFVVNEKDERIRVVVGNGLFGQLKENCEVPNVQEVHGDAIRALWPNRTMNLQDMFNKNSVFAKMGMKPVALEAAGAGKQPPIEGVNIAGIESGKLETPIIGVFAGSGLPPQ